MPTLHEGLDLLAKEKYGCNFSEIEFVRPDWEIEELREAAKAKAAEQPEAIKEQAAPIAPAEEVPAEPIEAAEQPEAKKKRQRKED